MALPSKPSASGDKKLPSLPSIPESDKKKPTERAESTDQLPETPREPAKNQERINRKRSQPSDVPSERQEKPVREKKSTVRNTQPSQPEPAPQKPAKKPKPKTAGETGATKEYNSVKDNDLDLGDGWFIDARTKVKYKGIPKLKDIINKGSGRSPGVITDDIDTLNLNSAAEIYLAHLRVPPDEKEMQKVIKEREARVQQINADYEAQWGKAEDDDDK